jgi:hypothetical protein
MALDAPRAVTLLGIGAAFIWLAKAWQNAPAPVSNLTFSNVGSGVATEAGAQSGAATLAANAAAAQMAGNASLYSGNSAASLADTFAHDRVTQIVINSGIWSGSTSPSGRAADRP